MKIDPIHLKAIKGSDLESKVKTDDKTQFQSHLDQAIETPKVDAGQKTFNPIEIQPAYHFDMVKTTPATQTLEKAISSLELYHNALTNPAIQYSQMEGLISGLNEEKDKLITSMQNLSHDDTLKTLIKETTLLILDTTKSYYEARV